MNRTNYERKLVTDKLNNMFNIQLIQSRVIEQSQNQILNQSIINQLDIQSSIQTNQICNKRFKTEQDNNYRQRTKSYNLMIGENSAKIAIQKSHQYESSYQPKYANYNPEKFLRDEKVMNIELNSKFYKNKLQLIDTLKKQSLLSQQKAFNKTNMSSHATIAKYQEQLNSSHNKLNQMKTTHNQPNRSSQPFLEIKQKSEPYLKKNKIDDIHQKYNKSIVIKMQNYLLSKMPICEICASPLNTVNKFHELQCSNCTNYQLKYKQLSEKLPLLGVLYEVENNINSNTWCLQSIRQIEKEILRMQQLIHKLQVLAKKIQEISKIKKETQQQLKIGKVQLYNLLKEQNAYQSFSNSKIVIESKLETIIPTKFIQELHIWSKINIDEFNLLPFTYESLNQYIPTFLKKPKPDILTYLQTLTNNFQNQTLVLSISTPIYQLSSLSLNHVKLIVDGNYNTIKFQHIKQLQLQFDGKRTSRELLTLIEKIPQTVQQITAKYDHLINSQSQTQHFPLLSKLCSFRMCKKIYIQINNLKQEYSDLLEMSKVLTKKKDLTVIIKKTIPTQQLNTTANLIGNSQYSYIKRNQEHIIQYGDQFILNNILKRVGKGLMKLHLNLPIKINRQKLFQNLILGGFYKLYSIKIITIGDYLVSHNTLSGYYQSIVNRMITKKQKVVYCLTKHKNKNILNNNKLLRQAVLSIIIGV